MTSFETKRLTVSYEKKVEEKTDSSPVETSGNDSKRKFLCPECKQEVEVISENTAVRPGIDNAVMICDNETCPRYKKPFTIRYAV